ncbi:inhibitor of growth protein 4 [Nematocida major]|uniref:inhibitor of growth protein 4 n=1 Tax=Nematocida major TaxID=1912982 RepID=UPI002008DA34|nr:inhibitor of growth protein 4 [Nematocida major]KAH9387206.1 inhibitor of growth protein 4 [Nematocida major]
MLIQEHIKIIEEAPQHIQSIISKIDELEHTVLSHKKTLSREIRLLNETLEDKTLGKAKEKASIDKQLQTINMCYLNLLDIDKKKLSLVSSLHSQLEGIKSLIKTSSAEFKEGIAKSSLTLKLKKIVSLLDYKIEEDNNEEEILCCTCKRPSKGEMLVCDSPECPIEWFHAACVGVKGVPKKKWLCSICSKE